MTDGGYEDEFDDTSIFENKSGLAEVSLVKRDSVTRFLPPTSYFVCRNYKAP